MLINSEPISLWVTRMKIRACLRCGSRNLDIADMRDGITPGIDWSTMVCRDCNWQGIPLEFETDRAYQQFLQGLKQYKKTEQPPPVVDVAESAPTSRFIVRYVTAAFLFLLFFILPGFVFFVVSVAGGLSVEIGFVCAGVSILVYFYIFLKKELWNLIKR
jgi:hypothetical protein